MLSKADVRFVRSLEMRKFRQTADAFVAEGPKVVEELSKSMRPRLLVQGDEVERASLLRAPQGVLAVFDIPHFPLPTDDEIGNNLILALDEVQDPGNVGTIIRLANWYGINHVMLGRGCADAFAPKTVQATMGSLARVRTHEVVLEEWLATLPEHTPVYGMCLDGDNIYNKELSKHGVIVMGNEGRGVSKAVGSHATERLLLPPYRSGRETGESLNVAIATAITCAEFRRR